MLLPEGVGGGRLSIDGSARGVGGSAGPSGFPPLPLCVGEGPSGWVGLFLPWSSQFWHEKEMDHAKIISTCMGAAPPSPIPPETRENVVTCQLSTCGQINFLQKRVFQYTLVLMYLQRCLYWVVPAPIKDRQKCQSLHRYAGSRYLQPWYPSRYDWLSSPGPEILTGAPRGLTSGLAPNDAGHLDTLHTSIAKVGYFTSGGQTDHPRAWISWPSELRQSYRDGEKTGTGHEWTCKCCGRHFTVHKHKLTMVVEGS